MTRTYKTLCSSTVIQVRTANGIRPVFFENGYLGLGTLRGGVFRTNNAELQAGIERHKRYNSGFDDQIWSDDVVEKPVEKHVAKEKPVQNKRRYERKRDS